MMLARRQMRARQLVFVAARKRIDVANGVPEFVHHVDLRCAHLERRRTDASRARHEDRHGAAREALCERGHDVVGVERDPATPPRHLAARKAAFGNLRERDRLLWFREDAANIHQSTPPPIRRTGTYRSRSRPGPLATAACLSGFIVRTKRGAPWTTFCGTRTTNSSLPDAFCARSRRPFAVPMLTTAGNSIGTGHRARRAPLEQARQQTDSNPMLTQMPTQTASALV